ncbi:MAG: hypothetical protein HYX64_06840 [Gammaproteobacteria bacterium]|nr:hypothetical protein [Gammaproteobacteria bacterium]
MGPHYAISQVDIEPAQSAVESALFPEFGHKQDLDGGLSQRTDHLLQKVHPTPGHRYLDLINAFSLHVLGENAPAQREVADIERRLHGVTHLRPQLPAQRTVGAGGNQEQLAQPDTVPPQLEGIVA